MVSAAPLQAQSSRRPDQRSGRSGVFLSPDGKTDPQAELAATLAQFFSTELVGRSKQPAQCAFVARYHWLKDKLAFDKRRLPPLRCERFDNWFKEMNAQSLTMIFPSSS